MFKETGPPLWEGKNVRALFPIVDALLRQGLTMKVDIIRDGEKGKKLESEGYGLGLQKPHFMDLSKNMNCQIPFRRLIALHSKEILKYGVSFWWRQWAQAYLASHP